MAGVGKVVRVVSDNRAILYSVPPLTSPPMLRAALVKSRYTHETYPVVNCRTSSFPGVDLVVAVRHTKQSRTQYRTIGRRHCSPADKLETQKNGCCLWKAAVSAES